MDHLRRQRQIAEQVERTGLDLLLVTPMPNVRYLCGFTGSAGVLAVGAGRPVLFTDGRYTEQARAEAQGARVVISKGSPLQAVARWLSRRRLRTVGVEGERMTLATRAALHRLLPARLRLRATAGLVEGA